ncbi:MAG: BatA domain-containing protein, partial [Planctomycetota bacterium]
MSFLQPWMLAAVPLAAIPIIIHLINQRRYQSLPWAAMRFLLSANQMNRGYAKIRRWLILAFRTLIIVALVLAVGRPLLSGTLGQGWIGSMIGRGTETAFVLIDRSPSMQRRSGDSAISQQDAGVSRVRQTLETLDIRRLLAVESNGSSVAEVSETEELTSSPLFGPSATSADLPAMILATLERIKADELGQTDLWICSDLQKNDWKPDDGRWATIRQSFAEFGRRIRFRVVSTKPSEATNRGVRVTSASIESRSGESFAKLSIEVLSDSEGASAVPVTIEIQGTRSTAEVNLQGGSGSLIDYELPLSAGEE